MTQEAQKSSSPDKGGRKIPEPVHLALEALKILEVEGRKIEGLNKSLPAFAMKRAQSDGSVTVETLLTHARAGELNLKRMIPEQKPRSLAEIVARFLKTSLMGADTAKVPAERLAGLFQGSRTMGIVASRGRLDAVKYFMEEYELKAEMCAQKEDALKNAAAYGHLDVVKYLVDAHQVDVHAGNEAALIMAARCGNLDVVKYLVETHQADVHAGNEKALEHAAYGNYPDTMKYLAEQGADISVLKSRDREILEKYLQLCAVWQKVAHADPPRNLYAENPVYYAPAAFNAVRSILRREMYNSKEADQMAFYVSGLFGTEGRVLQYLEKWGQAGKQPLHDVVYAIRLPKEKTMDLTAWADAVLKCGPSMAALVKFSDRLPVPEKSADGKTWSMVKTREKVAQFAYKRGVENVELAALCIEHSVDEKDFNEALALAKKFPKTKNIPEITVEGEKFDMEGGKFYRLPANDVRGLFLGELTDCCQSVGGAGAECAAYGFTSENSGFYVLENAKGKVVGQTWAWRGKKGELVFDSLETLGQNVTPGQWRKLTEAFSAELSVKPCDVTALHIGTGGKTPENLLKVFNSAAAPAIPVNYNGYRDSKKQVVAWNKNIK